MQFNRMTKEDIQNLSGFLLEQGTCSFVIKKAKEVRSKSGNPMIEIEMDVTDINNKVAAVFDYIFYSDAAKWKLVTFCKAVDMEEKLLEGMLEPRDLINKKGQLIVKHEEYNGDKKNKVNRYLPHLDLAMQQVEKEKIVKDFFPDEQIPF